MRPTRERAELLRPTVGWSAKPDALLRRIPSHYRRWLEAFDRRLERDVARARLGLPRVRDARLCRVSM